MTSPRISLYSYDDGSFCTIVKSLKVNERYWKHKHSFGCICAERAIGTLLKFKKAVSVRMFVRFLLRQLEKLSNSCEDRRINHKFEKMFAADRKL